MVKRHHLTALACGVCFLLSCHLGLARAKTLAPLRAASAAVQASPASDTERGVQLFQKGDIKGAVKTLRAAVKKSPEDYTAWRYLSLALFQRGELKESRKAVDKALALRPDSAEARAALSYFFWLTHKPREAEREAERALAADKNSVDAHYVIGLVRLQAGLWLRAFEEADTILKIDPNAAPAYYLRSQAALELYYRASSIVSDDRRGVYPFNEETVREARAAQSMRIKQATASLEKYLQLRPGATDASFLREQLETMRAYADASADGARKIYAGSELTTRAVIQRKPDPGFTEEARRAGITGVVRLRAVLASDGTVKHILVLKPLSHGLTEQSVKAARNIKFQPATLNGTPVSQLVQLEYNFNIY